MPLDDARRWRAYSFAVAMLALVIALVSPLDALSDRYLFAAHMIQHLLLLLPVPCLILWGAPEGWFAWIREWRLVERVLAWLGRPAIAFFLYVVLTWLWHVPLLYEAALANQTIHIGEHLCFLGSALLYWWPICRPRTHFQPISELVSLVYLFGAALSSTGLAALITFATVLLYPTYGIPGPYRTVQVVLGLSPITDQQVGALLMWIGGALWFLGAAMVIFIRWFERPPDDSSERFIANYLR